ncbi:hypothetical protein [Streptomyces qinglanensis]|uniref:hypothetical protein n=1 Tax=Streptomyces qinglanensis TaxID=943816 RepID=UPI0037B79E94
MRKVISGTAVLVTAALLTGCGGRDDGGSSADEDDKSAHESVQPKPKATSQPTPGTGSGSGEVEHKVALEVRGSGTSQISYTLATNKMETVKLPWKKTSTITLKTDAQKRIGTTVSVAPGSVPDSDGTLRPADCVITVDGKKVADNQGGASEKPCEYTVK